MEDRHSRRPRAGAEPPGLSPVRAFMLLGLVATAIAGGVTAFRDSAPAEPRPATAPSPDHSLTDAEALAEFERLNDQLMLAYRERNVALAEDVFSADSPMLPRVRKEIRTLVRSSTFSRTRFEPQGLRVVTSSASDLSVRAIEDVYPRFKTEDGKDSVGERDAFREWTIWELRVENGRWLLFDATVTQRKSLEALGNA